MENEYAQLLLGFTGVLLQLVFGYLPVVSDWYQKQSNKGLLMLGFVFAIALGYFGLSCTSLGAALGIMIACTADGAIVLFKALFIVATAQLATFTAVGKAQRFQRG